VSLLGDTLYPPELPPAIQEKRERELWAARKAYDRAPENADSIIWLGRRLAYLGRYREAIATYSEGIALHPNEARLYRHRGHRYISVRMFDRAVADFTKATRLVIGRPDEIEPDGQPNAIGVPLSTLKFNIWYHFGLAHYLMGDFQRAESAYRQALLVSRNADLLVATINWLYVTLRRQGRAAEAASVLGLVDADVDVVENDAYRRLLLMYNGEVSADSLWSEISDGGPVTDAAVAYGIGNWYLYNGRSADAERVFRRILEGSQWAPFGYIAAEAEVARLEETERPAPVP
jgi:tetratricopeptide (TPR) repeat protein